MMPEDEPEQHGALIELRGVIWSCCFDAHVRLVARFLLTGAARTERAFRGQQKEEKLRASTHEPRAQVARGV